MKKKRVQTNKTRKIKAGDDFSQRTVVIMLVLFLLVSLISLLVFLQALNQVKTTGAAYSTNHFLGDGNTVSQGPSSGKVILQIRERPENNPNLEVEE